MWVGSVALDMVALGIFLTGPCFLARGSWAMAAFSAPSPRPRFQARGLSPCVWLLAWTASQPTWTSTASLLIALLDWASALLPEARPAMPRHPRAFFSKGLSGSPDDYLALWRLSFRAPPLSRCRPAGRVARWCCASRRASPRPPLRSDGAF